MSGFELFDGDTKMRITEGSRVVLTTDGTLINLLPTSVNLSFNIVYPDFTKDYLYNWRHRFDYTSLGNMVGYDSGCITQQTVPKQDFSDEINLIAAPAGADIFIGTIVLNRTIAPTHTWNAVSIAPLQPTGVGIPLVSGSLLMEAAFGMVRACSIYVSSGQLKLHRQQSVSEPPGGWGLFGDGFNYFNPASGGGGENVFGSVAGIPVIGIDVRDVDSVTVPAGISAPVYDARTRRGGIAACSTTLTTNYSSTYSATLTGAFGRRS